MKIQKGNRKSMELKAVQLMARKIQSLAKTKEFVTLGLPGGQSVVGILKLLKTQKIPWQKVHVFMVDERFVPLDSKDSNFGQAKNLLLDYLEEQYLIPKQNVHPYIYFNLRADLGVRAYRNELREFSHHLDIVLLSAGQDGHVASLFPNHDTVKAPGEFFIVTRSAPKIPKSRMSASRKLLMKANTAILLFFGKEKSKAFENFGNPKMSIMDCPAKLVGKVEDSYVFTDLN